MENWKTVVDKIKELQKSKNLSAAKEELSIGLDKFPNQFNLLNIATDVCRASGDREKSLVYAELLITHFPDKPAGYIRSAQDLIALKRFKKAREDWNRSKSFSHVNLHHRKQSYRIWWSREISWVCRTSDNSSSRQTSRYLLSARSNFSRVWASTRGFK